MWLFLNLFRFLFWNKKSNKTKIEEVLNSQEVDTTVSTEVEDPSASSTNLQIVNGCFPGMCKNTLSCDLCDKFLVQSDMATSYANGRTFQIKGELHCQMPNTIYLVSCKFHRLQYVGSTSNVQKRWADHKSKMKAAIKAGLISNDSGLSEHVSAAHKEWPNPCDHLEVLLLESVQDVKNIRTREEFWITTLETLQYGLNKQRCAKKTKMVGTFGSHTQDEHLSSGDDGMSLHLVNFRQDDDNQVSAAKPLTKFGMDYRCPVEFDDLPMDEEDSIEETEDEHLEQTSGAATSHPEFGFELGGVETLINLFNFFRVES